MPRALLGVNLPYFYGAYGHDLAPSPRFPTWPADFDPMRAYRPLLEAKAIGLDAVRIWLCEGAEGLELDGDTVRGPHPRLLSAIEVLQEGAALAGLRIYWTLLDANSAARDGDELTRRILTDAGEAERFAERVAAKVARALDPSVLVGLEIVNEPEVLTESCKDVQPTPRPTVPWAQVGRAIDLARRAALAERGDLIVTAGTGHAFLPEGGLSSRADLAEYVGDPAILALPLIAGECGVTKPHKGEHALRNYLINADSNGYSSAFLWKLDGDLVASKEPGRPWTGTAREIHGELKARPAGGFVSGG
jgi:hypothetical protein